MFRISVLKVLHRLIGIGNLFSFYFIFFQTKIHIWLNCFLYHLYPVRSHGLNGSTRLMRWISVWQEPYLIESKKFICIISKHQVSIMNGIECPSHNSNLHIISSFMLHYGSTIFFLSSFPSLYNTIFLPIT